MLMVRMYGGASHSTEVESREISLIVGCVLMKGFLI